VSDKTGSFTDTDAWYALDGPEQDVVISTHLCLARNLANFPFPQYVRGDDGERIQALVFDAFSKMDNPESFQAISTERLDTLGKRILAERGVIPYEITRQFSGAYSGGAPAALSHPAPGIVVRSDGRLTCTVNHIDHVRISAFASGLDPAGVWQSAHDIDEKMQECLHFAATHDFGYLTASLSDAGSGMKLSVQVHLPSVALAGNLLTIIEAAESRGFSLSASYGSEAGASLGAYYHVTNNNSFTGNEFDQIASISSVAVYLADFERKLRQIVAENKPTILRDRVCKSFVQAKYSSFLTEREAITFLSDIKLGRDTGLLAGISYNDLAALLFRIKEAHLAFIAKSANFVFEKDAAESTELSINRMRSLIVHEALENVELTM
jgi:protein arginine kinase